MGIGHRAILTTLENRYINRVFQPKYVVKTFNFMQKTRFVYQKYVGECPN